MKEEMISGAFGADAKRSDRDARAPPESFGRGSAACRPDEF